MQKLEEVILKYKGPGRGESLDWFVRTQIEGPDIELYDRISEAAHDPKMWGANLSKSSNEVELMLIAKFNLDPKVARIMANEASFNWR